MLKKIIAVIALLSTLLCAAGCKNTVKNAVEGQDSPALPSLNLSSALVCTVDEITGSQCTVTVTEGNGTYDVDTTILVSFDAVTEEQHLSIGDVITFTYNYMENVSSVSRYDAENDVYHNIPHITVEEITVIPDYVPVTEPETTGK